MRGGRTSTFDVKVTGKPTLAEPSEGQYRSHFATQPPSVHTYRSPGIYHWRNCRVPEQRGSSEARLANRKGLVVDSVTEEAMAGSARDLVEMGA